MVYIFGNWKCNPTNLKKAKEIFYTIEKNFKGNKKVNVAVFPPFVFLNSLNSEKVKKGAQDVFWEKQGAFTGEISPLMLKDAGCRYCLVGHSERRYIIGENNEIIEKKLRSCLENKIVPILCFGEREKVSFGKVKIEIKEQLKFLINYKSFKNVILAYEPVFSIGTGLVCDTSHINDVLNFLKNELNIKYKVLYGGSLNSKNCQEILEKCDINGFLVGGASLKTREFLKIIEIAEKYAKSKEK